MADAASCANVPGTLVISYDSLETFSLLVDLAYSEAVFFERVIVLHADPSRLLLKLEKLGKLIEAAGGAVLNTEKKLLMIFRNDKWDLPKGKIEKRESSEEAAVREVEEECGIAGLSMVRSLTPTYHTYKLKEELILKKTWWYEMSCSSNQVLMPQLEEGITKVEWLSKEDVTKALSGTYFSVVDVVNELESTYPHV